MLHDSEAREEREFGICSEDSEFRFESRTIKKVLKCTNLFQMKTNIFNDYTQPGARA